MPNAKILTINNVDYDLKDENGRLGTASEFSTSSNYVIGDYCWYEDKLYRFTANHSSSTWTAAHATEVKIADELKTVNDETAELKDEIDKSILYNVNKASMWENGSIGSTGANTSNGSTTRIRTIGYVSDLHSVINSDYSNYNFMVCGYSKTDFSFLGTWRGTAWGNVAWANLGQLLTNFPDDACYRLVMRKADNSSEIIPANAECLELNKYMTVDYVQSTKNVPSIKMRSLYDLYNFATDATYPVSQGFCLVGDVAIVAKTTGTDSNQTKYVAVRVNPTTLAFEVLNETLLNTKHSNSLAYNPDTGKVICVTNQTVYIMSVSSDYALSIDSTITTSIHFSAVTYTGGVYYLYGEGYLWKTADFTNFVQLFIVNFAGYTSQGLATDGTYLYHCTSGSDYNVIWQYTLNGVLVNTRMLSAKYGELEEIDFSGANMYANIANTATGGGVRLITADNDVFDSVECVLAPSTVTTISPIDTANTNRWCAILETNGSSPNNQGAWLVMGYGAGAGRYSITPIKAAESITLAVSGATIRVTNSGTTSPRLFIHWLKPTTVTLSQAAVS